MSGGDAMIIAMVACYLLVTTWLTFKFRATNKQEFSVASRSVPAFVIGIVMMSEFIGAKSMIGTAQTAFEKGMAASWALITVGIGFPLFGIFLGRKLYSSGEYTISAAIANKYGRSTQVVVSIIMLYALLLVNIGYYIGGAASIASALHITFGQAAVLTASLSTAYCAIGGLKGATYVSVIHTGFKFVGVTIVLCVALFMTGGMRPVLNSLPPSYFTWDGSIGVSTILAWTVANIGAIFSTQYIIQAISALKSSADVKKASYIAGAFCVPLGVALGIIGVSAKFLFPNANSLYAFMIFQDHMSPLASGMVTIALVASVLVGVSSISVGMTALIVRDFYVPMFKPTESDEFRMSRFLSIPIGLLPLAFVFFAQDMLALTFFTRALRLSVTVVALIAFYLPFLRSNRGATWGLIAAVFATTMWHMLGNPYGIDNIYIALATPAIVMAFDRLFRRSGAILAADVPK